MVLKLIFSLARRKIVRLLVGLLRKIFLIRPWSGVTVNKYFTKKVPPSHYLLAKKYTPAIVSWEIMTPVSKQGLL